MKFLILGSGMMGKGICFNLCSHDEVSSIILADRDKERAERVAGEMGSPKVKAAAFEATDERRVSELMKESSIALSATSYDHNLKYTEIAIDSGCSFVDLGGNHDIVDRQFELSEKARSRGISVIPDCGLAPGLVNILSARAVEQFDIVDTVEIRVGGIPVNPVPPLNYFLVFSARGLINEYTEKSRIIENDEVVEVDSMEGLETLFFQDPFGKMEAFYTSGGISTLIRTMKGRVKNLNYKTIRFPGHQHYIKFLMTLGLTGSEPVKINGQQIPPRNVLELLLEKYLGFDNRDATLLRVTARGTVNDIATIFTQECIDFHDRKHNLTSMMKMTAFSAAIVALMIAKGDIRDKGVLYQEKAVPWQRFIEELEKWKISISTRRQQI